MDDGNNIVNPRATLKINWRADVKDAWSRRVALACEVVPMRLVRCDGLVDWPIYT